MNTCTCIRTGPRRDHHNCPFVWGEMKTYVPRADLSEADGRFVLHCARAMVYTDGTTRRRRRKWRRLRRVHRAHRTSIYNFIIGRTRVNLDICVKISLAEWCGRRCFTTSYFELEKKQAGPKLPLYLSAGYPLHRLSGLFIICSVTWPHRRHVRPQVHSYQSNPSPFCYAAGKKKGRE